LAKLTSDVVGCDIYQTGQGGIHLEGGDRKTLTPAGHYSDNNHIHDTARWDPVYQQAIKAFVMERKRFHAPHPPQIIDVQLLGSPVVWAPFSNGWERVLRSRQWKRLLVGQAN
jgi:hypothetical protein